MSLRVAFLGAGRMAAQHVKNLTAIEGVQVAAVSDRHLQRAQEMVQPFGGRAYTDHRELLAQERDLDAVYVCTPVQQHYQQALDVAAAGKALFLEKPVAWTLGEAAAIAEAVKRAGIICAIGYQLRYRDTIQAALEIWGNRPAALVRAHYYWGMPMANAMRNKDLAGGQIFDQVTHLIDLSRLFVGEVESVKAEYTLNARTGEFHNWDGYALTLRYKSGAVGSFASTYALWQMPEQDPLTLDICGREILIRLAGERVEIRTPEGSRVLGGTDPSIDTAFVDSIRKGDARLLRGSVDEAIKTLAVTLAANRAAVTGQSIQVDAFLKEALDQ